MDPQTAFSFDKVTLTKIGKGLIIAVAGAVLTYVVSYLTNTNFGNFTPLAVAAASVLVNAGKEFVSGTPNTN